MAIVPKIVRHFITKMMNEWGLARRTAAVIGQAEAFRGDS
jgi:hypothetical protein